LNALLFSINFRVQLFAIGITDLCNLDVLRMLIDNSLFFMALLVALNSDGGDFSAAFYLSVNAAISL
jgi:hypothetical protein